MKYDLEDINKYATGIGFQDTILYDYTNHRMSTILGDLRGLGLIVHIWTFKDDVLLFEAKTNIVTYFSLFRICINMLS